jgi:SnoaL-like domain
MPTLRFIRSLLGLASAILIGAAPAGAAPVVIAGGALDPAYTQADVYLDTPPAPPVPAGPACAAARAYVELHQAGRYAEVADLFSDDAALLEPSRLDVRGKAGITRFYVDAIGRLKPDIVGVFYLGDATDCMVELAVRQMIDGKLRYRLASMDHFTVDASGKVIRMVAFQRPSKIGLAPPQLDK